MGPRAFCWLALVVAACGEEGGICTATPCDADQLPQSSSCYQPLAPRNWTWTRTDKACDEVGFAPACTTWQQPTAHVCGRIVPPIEFVENGATTIEDQACYYCWPDDGTQGDPTNDDRCAVDRERHGGFDPRNGSFSLDGYRWSRMSCDQPWSVLPPRDPDAPVGADYVLMSCDATLVAGSVDPATSPDCGYP